MNEFMMCERRKYAYINHKLPNSEISKPKTLDSGKICLKRIGNRSLMKRKGYGLFTCINVQREGKRNTTQGSGSINKNIQRSVY